MSVSAHVTLSEFPIGTVLFISGFMAGLVAAYALGRLRSWRLGETGGSDRGRQLTLQ
jgi:hypothetical protein